MVAVPLLLSACDSGVLDPHGPVSSQQRTILIDSMAIMLAIVLPTIVATLAFGWWFRASNTRAKYRPDWIYSGTIELVVWGVPLLTIMLLGGVIWVSSHQLDPAKPLASNNKPIEVQAVSLDWKWLFIYPDLHLASVNTITVPVGVPVHFSLTSGSVMNSFQVPQLGSQLYTMNGMSGQLNLMADKPGTYPGLSTHYSGDGFSGMYFALHAVPQPAFDEWVANTRKDGPVLDEASYTKLSWQSSNVAPFTYKDAEAGLYDRIVTQQIPPAPGPQAGLPSKDVSNRSN